MLFPAISSKYSQCFLQYVTAARSHTLSIPVIFLTKEEADKYIRKMINLRIFEDENGKTNCSLKDVDGELLLVSQFTLYASCRKGNRPSFTQAGDPKKAEELYEYIIKECNKEIDVVQTGIFGAHMEVALINDGPFTVVLEDL